MRITFWGVELADIWKERVAKSKSRLGSAKLPRTSTEKRGKKRNEEPDAIPRTQKC